MADSVYEDAVARLDREPGLLPDPIARLVGEQLMPGHGLNDERYGTAVTDGELARAVLSLPAPGADRSITADQICAAALAHTQHFGSREPSDEDIEIAETMFRAAGFTIVGETPTSGGAR